MFILQEDKTIYDALNHQLIDEIPKFCDFANKLLEHCLQIFIHLQKCPQGGMTNKQMTQTSP